MPWKIENKELGYVKYILPNIKYNVGRNAGDIIVSHKSISRNHAVVEWNVNTGKLLVQDLSKFGTSINSICLNSKEGELRCGDKLTFGAQPGVTFNVSFQEVDAVHSALSSLDKKLVNEYLSAFGGNLLPDWKDSVQYLVTNSVKVTYKVICALIKQVYLVTPDFFKAFREYFIGSLSDPPNEKLYLPPIGDENIRNRNISLHPVIERLTLFNGKTFYFLTADKLAKLETAITSASGQTFLLTDTTGHLSDETLLSHLNRENSILLCEFNETPFIHRVYSIMKQIGKRPVIDSEIGYAVLYASLDDYCNSTKECNKKIYSELKLSQNLSVNPFHIEPKQIPQMFSRNNSTGRLAVGDIESKQSKRMNLSRKRSSPLKAKESDEGTVNQLNKLLVQNKENVSWSNLGFGKLQSKSSLSSDNLIRTGTLQQNKPTLSRKRSTSLKSIEEEQFIKQSNKPLVVNNENDCLSDLHLEKPPSKSGLFGHDIETNEDKFVGDFDDMFDKIDLPTDGGVLGGTADKLNYNNRNKVRDNKKIVNNQKLCSNEVPLNKSQMDQPSNVLSVVPTNIINSPSPCKSQQNNQTHSKDSLIPRPAANIVFQSTDGIYKLFKKVTAPYFHDCEIPLKAFKMT